MALFPAAAPRAQHSEVLVFAASSLQTALDEVTPGLERATGFNVRISYAASSTLARQIENGAPAELFISADTNWMDDVNAKGLIDVSSRVTLMGNTLVLVAPKAQPVSLKITPGFPLASRLGDGRLAIAAPDTVPAGRYAKQALTALGAWNSVATRLAPAENVRAALAYVARGEAPLGIVYRTDAIAEPGVTIVDTFPATLHARIVYPAALTVTATPAAARVLAYLRGAEARAVFARQGFLVDVK